MHIDCQFSKADELRAFSTLDWRCELVKNLLGLFFTTIVYWSFYPRFWLDLGGSRYPILNWQRCELILNVVALFFTTVIHLLFFSHS